MKKYRVAAALCAVFLMAVLVSPVVYAAPLDEAPEVITGDLTEAEDMEAAPVPEETGPVIPAEPTVSAVDENELVAPPGAGTVVDHTVTGTAEEGKEFYTIMTPDEFVFYLVIDKQRSGQNVYFLNAVTIADLMALAEQGGSAGSNGSVSAVPGGVTEKPITGELTPEPSPEPEPEQEPQSGGNMGMIVFVVVILLAGGGAAYYFKVFRPKQQKADSEDDYDYSEDEADPYGIAEPDASRLPDDNAQSWYDEGDDDSGEEYDGEDDSGGGDGEA